MKTNTFRFLALIFSASLLFAACSSDDDDNNDLIPENIPTVIQANGEWVEDSLATGEVKWYKVTGEVTIVGMNITWSEFENHGNNKYYSGDIQVSAYMLDGETPHQTNDKDFVAIDNGYTSPKSIDLGGEKDILLKVELTEDNIPGTYALKITGKEPTTGDITYTTIEVKDEWTQASIETGEIVGFEIDATNFAKLQIIWAEEGSPEDAGAVDFTGEVMGSVYMSDGETAYIQYENTKEFVDKDKSWSDNPKAIEVDATDKTIKVHFSVNTTPGTFAIKVIELL